MSTALTTLAGAMATRLNLGGDVKDLLSTLKATAFKGNVSDAQMASLLLVAQQYNLNPWTKEIYAFPDKNNGIVPVVGVDGWSRIMNGDPNFDGMEFQQDDESCTCRIFRKDRGHPISVTEYMDECKREVGPWKSHPKRMLRHKAMIQCARLAFGFVGIYDQDEAERINESIDTKTGEVYKRPTPQAAVDASVPDDYEDYEADILPMMQEAAVNGPDALADTFKKLMVSDNKKSFWAKHGAALKKLAEQSKNIVEVV